MKIFISWSGERSLLVATLLKDWLKNVLQSLEIFVSEADIQKGSDWSVEIQSQLNESKCGIVCLTNENKNAPWVLFEAGALAKGVLTNRVCTFLIDFQKSDLKPPLSIFQATEAIKNDTFELCKTFNARLKENNEIHLDDDRLKHIFETFWSQFETSFNEIISKTSSRKKIAKRTNEEILEELLDLTRGINREISQLKKGEVDTSTIVKKSLHESLMDSLAPYQPATKAVEDMQINLEKKMADIAKNISVPSLVNDKARMVMANLTKDLNYNISKQAIEASKLLATPSPAVLEFQKTMEKINESHANTLKKLFESYKPMNWIEQIDRTYLQNAKSLKKTCKNETNINSLINESEQQNKSAKKE